MNYREAIYNAVMTLSTLRRRARANDKHRQNKPAGLPVQQSTKGQFVVNLKTAKTLGLAFPLPLIGREAPWETSENSPVQKSEREPR